jgi:hypothetical protein
MSGMLRAMKLVRNRDFDSSSFFNLRSISLCQVRL